MNRKPMPIDVQSVDVLAVFSQLGESLISDKPLTSDVTMRVRVLRTDLSDFASSLGEDELKVYQKGAQYGASEILIRLAESKKKKQKTEADLHDAFLVRLLAELNDECPLTHAELSRRLGYRPNALSTFLSRHPGYSEYFYVFISDTDKRIRFYMIRPQGKTLLLEHNRRRLASERRYAYEMAAKSPMTGGNNNGKRRNPAYIG